MDVFSALAMDLANDQSTTKQTNARIASTERVETRFGTYLAAARTPAEMEARLSLQMPSIRQTVREACVSHGYDDVEGMIGQTVSHLKESWNFDKKKDDGAEEPKSDTDEGPADDTDEKPDKEDDDEDDSKQSSVRITHELIDSTDNDSHDSGSKEEMQAEADRRNADEGGNRWRVKPDGWSDGNYKGAAVKQADGAKGTDMERQHERIDPEGTPGPSPKIDKSRVPADGLSPIDDGSKQHPHTTLDPARGVFKDQRDPFEMDKKPEEMALGEMVDAEKSMQPEKMDTSGQSGTFDNKSTETTNPVTRAAAVKEAMPVNEERLLTADEVRNLQRFINKVAMSSDPNVATEAEQWADWIATPPAAGPTEADAFHLED